MYYISTSVEKKRYGEENTWTFVFFNFFFCFLSSNCLGYCSISSLDFYIYSPWITTWPFCKAKNRSHGNPNFSSKEQKMRLLMDTSLKLYIQAPLRGLITRLGKAFKPSFNFRQRYVSGDSTARERKSGAVDKSTWGRWAHARLWRERSGIFGWWAVRRTTRSARYGHSSSLCTPDNFKGQVLKDLFGS